MTLKTRLPRLSVIFGVLVLILVGLALWNFRTAATHPELDAIRQQGYPATLSEMNEWYYRPPDSENAALYYTNALAKLLTLTNLIHKASGDDSLLPKRGEAFSDEDKSELLAICSTNRDLLALFYATNIPALARYPVDFTLGYRMLLPHLAHVRSGVRTLTVIGMLQFQENQPGQGVNSFLAAGRLARSMMPEPIFISQLVEIANWAFICKRLEWSLNAARLSSDELFALQQMITDAETNAFYRGLVSEQAAGLDVFNNPETQWHVLVDMPALPGPAPELGDRLKSAALVGFLKTTGFFGKDRQFFARTISNAVAVARLPLPERYTASQRISFVPPNRLCIISGMLLPSLTKAYTRDATRAANMRTTKTALAIERFRLANSNALPATLNDLVPNFLTQVPDDPFDGRPLRYQKRSSGYVVYSVGSDLQDDNGKEYDKKNASARSDITFILER